MGEKQTRTWRAFLIVSGAVLVGIFLAWVALRRHEVMQDLFAMDSVWGWVAHGAVLLSLFGGVALLARGTYRPAGESRRDTPGADD